MSELALGSIDYALEEVDRVKHICNRCHFEDCVYHLKKARESLLNGINKPPLEWDTILQSVLLFKMLLDKNIDTS